MHLMGMIPGMEEMATEGTGEVDHRHHLIQMISLKGIRTVRCPEGTGMVLILLTVVMTVMMIPMMMMMMMRSSGVE